MKTSKILLAFALLAFVTVACHKNDAPTVKKAEIMANVSGSVTDDDGNTESLTWLNGNSIALVKGSGVLRFDFVGAPGSTSAKFEGDQEGGAGCASVPYSEGSSVDEDGTFRFFFPAVQKIAGNIASAEFCTANNVKVLVAQREGQEALEFENIASYLRVPITSDEANCEVDSVEISPIGSYGIAGNTTVIWKADNTIRITPEPNALHSSKVVFEQGFKASSEPVYVTVPIIPGDYPKGFQVKVYTKVMNPATAFSEKEAGEEEVEVGLLAEAGKVYTTPVVACGNTYSILADGSTFNTKIKDMAMRAFQKPVPDTSDFLVTKISFHVNYDMSEFSGKDMLDLSQKEDGSILADIDEEGQVGVYTSSATIAVVNTSNMFHRFAALEDIEGLETIDTYGATAMKHMFSCAKKLKRLDLSTFNNANAVGVDSMFWRCNGLEELILSDNFITSKVLRAVALFHSCHSLKKVDVSKFDLTNCASISQMFQYCWAMEEIELPLDASACTSISQLFYNCKNTKRIDLSNFKTSENLVSTRYFMYECHALEGNLDFRNMNTIKDTCFYTALTGISNVDTIFFGENFSLNAAAKRSETKETPFRNFFGSSSSPTSLTSFVGAARTPEDPTVVVCTRNFLQQLIMQHWKDTEAPRIQMKNGKIKFVNLNLNPFTLKTKAGDPIALSDINTATSTYIVVDPDETE